MTGTGAVHQVIARRAIPGSMPLAGIVTAFCLRTGLIEADLDVSELTDGVRGYALARQVSVRGALEMLAGRWTQCFWRRAATVQGSARYSAAANGHDPAGSMPARHALPLKSLSSH